MYQSRVVDQELDELQLSLPAIAVEGAKGVGKTATALRRAQTSWVLDDAAQRAIVEADLAGALNHAPPVLIDEWQRVPAIWDHVRRAVDAGAAPGAVLLTGSAAPVDTNLHSGAGRIAALRMRPLALSERMPASPGVSITNLAAGSGAAISGQTAHGLAWYADEIVQSGFPGMRHLRGRALRTQLDTYLDRLAERDFAELGHRVRSPQLLRRWMVAYAAAVSTCASYETIRNAATGGEGDKPSRSTTQPYRETLERLFIIESVPGWAPTRSRIARLATPPKHQLVDPALAARLLGIDAPGLLRDGVAFGALFESLVTATVRVCAQHAEMRVGHLRTKGGEREVDLILERSDGRIIAIEIKLGDTVTDGDVRHLTWLHKQMGSDLLDSVVITTGSQAYRRADGIAVVPAALLRP